MRQVADIIDGGQYPLFVSEASSHNKLAQIKADSYLDNAYKRVRDLTHSLVILGSSIHEVDRHIWDAIQFSSVDTIYVGTRQRPDQAGYRAIRQRIEAQLEEPRRRRQL
jgi:Domain of unknown function (DUF4917)